MGHLYHGYVSHNQRVTYRPIKKSHRLWGFRLCHVWPGGYGTTIHWAHQTAKDDRHSHVRRGTSRA